MKKLKDWIPCIIGVILSFILGRVSRQSEVNKLKKSIDILQRDQRKLINYISTIKTQYRDLLVQHKGWKALGLKKILMKNLITQYALKEYIVLLLKGTKHGQKLSKEETEFFGAFEKMIEGTDNLLTQDMQQIREYIMEKYGDVISQQKECDYESVLDEIQTVIDSPKTIVCGVKLGKKKRIRYYLTDNDSLAERTFVDVFTRKNRIVSGEVVSVEKYLIDDLPRQYRKLPHLKSSIDEGKKSRKFQEQIEHLVE